LNSSVTARYSINNLDLIGNIDMKIAAALMLALVAAGALAEEFQAYGFNRTGWPDGTPQYGFQGDIAEGVDGTSRPPEQQGYYEGTVATGGLFASEDMPLSLRSPRETIEYQNGDAPLTR
jgi:hypothetical protein